MVLKFFDSNCSRLSISPLNCQVFKRGLTVLYTTHTFSTSCVPSRFLNARAAPDCTCRARAPREMVGQALESSTAQRRFFGALLFFLVLFMSTDELIHACISMCSAATTIATTTTKTAATKTTAHHQQQYHNQTSVRVGSCSFP